MYYCLLIEGYAFYVYFGAINATNILGRSRRKLNRIQLLNQDRAPWVLWIASASDGSISSRTSSSCLTGPLTPHNFLTQCDSDIDRNSPVQTDPNNIWIHFSLGSR